SCASELSTLPTPSPDLMTRRAKQVTQGKTATKTVQLRQRAIDAANAIPGFDDAPCKASDAGKDSDED
ncbi:hypothetical protein C5706_33370, partial [Klebsiella pneumoniae]